MHSVRFINVIPKFPYQRQLPAKAQEEWGMHFFFGPGEEKTDFLVCYDELKQELATQVPWERRLLIIGEPPCITRYPSEFLNLFGMAVCSYPLPKYKGLHVREHSSLWWFYGINNPAKGIVARQAARNLTWDELETLPKPEKNRDISIICSNKGYCRMHSQRRNVAMRLKEHFGARLEIFGPSYQWVDDKKDAIDPFKYHIVIENNDEPGFWTEKLADSFLGRAFPFYVGGQGVELDFPLGAMQRLDIQSIPKAIEQLEQALARKTWEHSQSAIEEARIKILHEYNMFERVRLLTKKMPVLPALEQAEILPAFYITRKPYHFRDHINHMAFKHLPIKKPIFPL